MKTSVKVLCAVAFGLSVFTATAGEKIPAKRTGKTRPAVMKTTKTAPEKKETLTGSLIPRKPEVSGYIAATASPVVVIDSEMIRRSGAHDLSDLLRRGGWAR